MPSRHAKKRYHFAVREGETTFAALRRAAHDAANQRGKSGHVRQPIGEQLLKHYSRIEAHVPSSLAQLIEIQTESPEPLFNRVKVRFARD